MRKLMWFTLGFGAACAFGAYCGMSWVLSLGLFAGAAAVILLFAVKFWRPCRIAAAIGIGLLAGCLMLQIYDVATLSAARQLDGQTIWKTVIVHDYSYEYGYGSAVDGSVEIDGKQYRVRVYLNDVVELEPGNRIVGEFKFRYTSAGGLDEVLYHRSEGIFLLASQRGNCIVERFWTVPLLDMPAVWRQKLLDVIDGCFEADTAGFAKALLLGDRTGIDTAPEAPAIGE